MQVSVCDRLIEYDFERKEVDFLKSVGVWDTLKQNLHEHEKITIEGYERFEADEG